MGKRPSSVKIGPHQFQILWSKESWKKYAPKELEKDDHLGLTKSVHNLILVKGWDVAESVQAETLCHELTHACLSVTGYSDMPISTKDNFDTEETVIRLLSPIWLQMLQDNPPIVDYLVDSK